MIAEYFEFIVIFLLHQVINCLGSRLRVKNGSEEQLKPAHVLHHSQNFIVLNKAYDLVINSNDPQEKLSLDRQLCSQFPHLVNPKLQHNFYFVHRLDYATSGVICIALHKVACSAASRAFQARMVKKYYLALLRGHVGREALTITVALGEDKTELMGNHQMCVASSASCLHPKPCRTRLLVLSRGRYAGLPATKVLMRPITGRRHQLRVHTAILGHTIVGDYTYSQRRDVAPYRQFLHAFRLILPNKVEPLDIQTGDPFTESDPRNEWTPLEIVNTLDASAFDKLDKDPEEVVTENHSVG